MRPGRVRQSPIPQPAHSLREAPASTSLPPNCFPPSYRAALFCTTCRQDTDRDTNQGYVVEWRVIQLALYAAAITKRECLYYSVKMIILGKFYARLFCTCMVCDV